MADFIANVGSERIAHGSRVSGPNTGISSHKYRADQAESTAGSRTGPDRVELSLEARMLRVLTEGDPVRRDLVDRVKEQIASGEYMNKEKLDIAVERMIEDVREELF
ncbi:MAG: hypothetical protein D8M59_02790 [Planctomycetes bacterium]|nr:hypothetical protein [Planctomycetota bacterium]NOG52922.1 hypothetical protein [Planctomycetota bacterium]